MLSFVRSLARSWRSDGRTDGRSDGRPSDSFSSLWAAFRPTLTVPINALYNETLHGKEKYAT